MVDVVKGEPQHDAKWIPTSAFVDSDGTLTESFYQYITHEDLLPQLRAVAETATGGEGGIVQHDTKDDGPDVHLQSD